MNSTLLYVCNTLSIDLLLYQRMYIIHLDVIQQQYDCVNYTYNSLALYGQRVVRPLHKSFHRRSSCWARSTTAADESLVVFQMIWEATASFLGLFVCLWGVEN
jgi:hypothetical protein